MLQKNLREVAEGTSGEAVGGGAPNIVSVKKQEPVQQTLLAPGWSIRTSLRYVKLDPSLDGKRKTVSVYTLGGELVYVKA